MRHLADALLHGQLGVSKLKPMAALRAAVARAHLVYMFSYLESTAYGEFRHQRLSVFQVHLISFDTN